MKKVLLPLQLVQGIINYLDNSNLPHKDVKGMIKDLTESAEYPEEETEKE